MRQFLSYWRQQDPFSQGAMFATLGTEEAREVKRVMGTPNPLAKIREMKRWSLPSGPYIPAEEKLRRLEARAEMTREFLAGGVPAWMKRVAPYCKVVESYTNSEGSKMNVWVETTRETIKMCFPLFAEISDRWDVGKKVESKTLFTCWTADIGIACVQVKIREREVYAGERIGDCAVRAEMGMNLPPSMRYYLVCQNV